jgi:hypothetical protein
VIWADADPALRIRGTMAAAPADWMRVLRFIWAPMRVVVI